MAAGVGNCCRLSCALPTQPPAATSPSHPVQIGSDGQEIMLKPPTGDELPARGFDPGQETYQAPAGSAVEVRPRPALLAPGAPRAPAKQAAQSPGGPPAQPACAALRPAASFCACALLYPL